jgi:uncharacterized protein YjbI with pentapeptide repeats
MFNLSPRLFISYSRDDHQFVDKLVTGLVQRGFSVFRDTSDIDPGDNFVSTIAKEIRRSTGVVAVMSDRYAESRWGKAELYAALASGKVTIPLVLSRTSLEALDEPLQRMLRDTNYVTANPDVGDPVVSNGFAELLAKARSRHLREIVVRRVLPIALVLLLGFAVVWWAVANLNRLDESRRRDAVLSEIVNAKGAIQHEGIVHLASAVAGDRVALGELLFLTQEPSISDMGRFNAIALGSELRKGQKVYRWYPRGLNIDRAQLTGIVLANVSFLGGTWTNVQIEDATFSGAFWSKGNGVSLSASTFKNVQFYGSEIEGITAVDVSFVNSKFRGSTIDTTHFSKVRFSTKSPASEGNPVITPFYTLFERSVLISNREPPTPGVMDLTAVGDDVVFDGVVFVDCRLEGWFRPEWFRNSSFERCVLPESLDKRRLMKAGNTVD